MPVTTGQTTFTDAEIREALVNYLAAQCGGDGPRVDPSSISFLDDGGEEFLFEISAIAHH